MIFRVTNQVNEEIFESRSETDIENYRRELIEKLNLDCDDETPYTIEDDTHVIEIDEDIITEYEFYN